MQPYEPGTRLRDRYEVVEVLERTEARTLYRVHDGRFACDWFLYEMDVARVPAASRDDACAAFAAQAARFAALRHPGLAQVADHWVDRTTERAAFLTQATRGASLRDELVRSPQGFSLDRVVELGTKMLDVLYFFHTGYDPVVFKALSLGNVWITEDDEINLTDFCLPSWLDPRRYSEPATYHEAADGFAPPEVVRGEPATLLSDIWAAGAVLHAFALGAPPVGGEVDARAAERIPKALLAVLAKCLQPLPADRYHDVGAVKHDLMAVAEAFAPESSPSTGGLASVADTAPASQPGTRPRGGCGAAVLLLMLTTVATLVGWVQAR